MIRQNILNNGSVVDEKGLGLRGWTDTNTNRERVRDKDERQ